MTFVETISAVGTRMVAPRGRRCGLAVAVLSAVVVMPVLSGSAAADPIGDAQAQASQVTAQIAQMGTRIHRLTERYTQASQRAALSATQLDQDRAALDSTQRDVDATRALLRFQAVNAYVHNLSGGAGAQLASGSPAVDLLVSREYLSVATGNVSQTIDRLRVALATLGTSADTLRKEQQAAARARDQVAQARRAALAEANKEEATLAQVRSHLANLVALADAARVAAANAAAAREVAAAAARAEASRSTVAAAQAARVPTQGLPVAGGVVSAVAAATGVPAPVPPPAAPGRPGKAAPAPEPPAAPATPAPAAPAPAPGGGGGAGGVWAALRQCESGGNYAENTGNGYYGAYQFSQSTWSGLGFPGRPDLEPPAMQDQAAQKLQSIAGWAPWPTCAGALGLL